MNLPILSVGGVPVQQVQGTHLPGAHHPHCDRHRHHLLWIMGRPLCLGCTCMVAGTCIGVALAYWSQTWFHHWVAWFVAHAVAVAPTAAQPWFQRKTYKMGARSLLGIATGSYLLGAAWFAPFPSPRLLWTAASLCAFALTARLLLWIRARHIDDPCRDCPQGSFPICEWNMRLPHQGGIRVVS